MAQDSDPLLIILLGAGVVFLLTRPSNKDANNPDCTWWQWLLGNCGAANQNPYNPYPPGYTYQAETVTQAGPIAPSPITSTGTIEGGTSLVTQSGKCQYPDGTIWTGPVGSICPIDLPNHGGQSLPI